MDDGQPSSRRTADRIYLALRDSILEGSLSPGHHLSVPALAERMGVSRSPVREAVQRLTQDGLATEAPHRGAVVAHIGLPELAALYEVREVLEGLAARLAVENSGRRLVRALGDVLAEHEAAVTRGDNSAHTEIDIRFHRLIRTAAQNRDLLQLLEQIQAKVRLAMLSTTGGRGPRLALADHKTIYEAIVAGDASAAAEASRRHIARLREALERQIEAGVPQDAVV